MRLQAAWVLYFNEVARCRSIREAARRLKVSPSAISRQIKDLEQTLGESLLARMPGGLRLTAAGEAVAYHASHVLNNLERMRTSLDELRDLHRGVVRIAAIQATSADFLPQLIATFRKSHPRITFEIKFTNSASVAKHVDEGIADVGISFNSFPVNGVRHLIAAPMPFGALVPPEHPLAAQQTLALHDLADLPMLLPDDSISTRILLNELFRGTSLNFSAAVISTSPEFIVAAAVKGAGIAFQTPVGVEREMREKRLTFVPLVDRRLKPPELTVSVSTRHPPTVLSSMVAEAARASVAGLLESLTHSDASAEKQARWSLPCVATGPA
jgi:DNA-binding transcriptional LysR family regulator